MKYYAIAKGRDTGIFKSWDQAKPLVENIRVLSIKVSNVLKMLYNL